MGFANYIRPIALLFVISAVLYLYLSNTAKIRAIVCFMVGIFIANIGIGLFNISNNGHFMISASTSGVNLIMGANNYADGSYNDSCFEKGQLGDLSEYKGELNVFTRDSIYKNRAIEWIKNHPGDYLKLIPIKITRLWIGDSYQEMIFNPSYKEDVSFHKRIIKIITFSISYYIILLLAIVGMIISRKKFFRELGVWTLPIIGACIMHAILYGGMRYHYPYIPLLILFATIPIMKWYQKFANHLQ